MRKILLIPLLLPILFRAQTHLSIEEGKVLLTLDEKVLMQSPSEGLWSIASQWEDSWPSQWDHATIDTVIQNGILIRGQG